MHFLLQKPHMLASPQTCAQYAQPASIPPQAPPAPTALLDPSAVMERPLANLALPVNGVTAALPTIALPALLANGLHHLARHLKLPALAVKLVTMPILRTLIIPRTTASPAKRASTPLLHQQATLHALHALMVLIVQVRVNPL